MYPSNMLTSLHVFWVPTLTYTYDEKRTLEFTEKVVFGCVVHLSTLNLSFIGPVCICFWWDILQHVTVKPFSCSVPFLMDMICVFI